MTLLRSEPGVTRCVDLDAAPAEVWDALTEQTLLAGWLADEVEFEPEPGGEIVCRYADGEERHGEVELVEEADGWPGAGTARAPARAGSNWSSTRSPTAPA